MLVWRDQESELVVSMSLHVWQKITKLANRKYPKECGGFLIGEYSSDLKVAVIEDMHFSRKSRCESTMFYTDPRRGNLFLKFKWAFSGGSKYYVGEWHSHPDTSSVPSAIDDDSMFAISCNDSCQCSRPILIILSGNKVSGWSSGYINIYTKEGAKFGLKLVKGENK